MTSRRAVLRGAVTAAAAGIIAAAAPLAGAAGPTRQPTNNQPGVLPAGSACAFAVGVGIVTDRETTTTWPVDRNGDVRSHVNGTLVLSLTNQDTGATIVVDASGPGDFVTHADGSHDITFLGNSVLIVPPGGSRPTPDSIITSGRAVEHDTPDATASLASVSGRTQDVCQELS
jgi:hypothetical protein